MKIFDVQGIEIKAPVSDVFNYIADPRNLPKWTHAFKAVSDGQALLETPNGFIEIKLEVKASKAQGTIDWVMTFPDGSVSTAYSRVVDSGRGSSIYSFVLLAPPVPLEHIEGALEQQTRILRDELSNLTKILER
jgi:hypothetical protein